MNSGGSMCLHFRQHHQTNRSKNYAVNGIDRTYKKIFPSKKKLLLRRAPEKSL